MDVNNIIKFRGTYSFLSNFFNLQNPVDHDGLKFWTVEHAYQSAKTFDKKDKLVIQSLNSASEAKKYGKTVGMRPDWLSVREAIMLDLVSQKFFNNSELMGRLLLTGKAEIIEGNYWHDNFWGQCFCESCTKLSDPARNVLGCILMAIRDHIPTKESTW